MIAAGLSGILIFLLVFAVLFYLGLLFGLIIGVIILSYYIAKCYTMTHQVQS